MSTNKFLSLDWFKETAENAITKVLANKLEKLMEQDVVQDQQCSAKPEKLYFSMKIGGL
jgi:flagellar biosynthesis regulator FlbT